MYVINRGAVLPIRAAKTNNGYRDCAREERTLATVPTIIQYLILEELTRYIKSYLLLAKQISYHRILVGTRDGPTHAGQSSVKRTKSDMGAIQTRKVQVALKSLFYRKPTVRPCSNCSQKNRDQVTVHRARPNVQTAAGGTPSMH